MLMTLHGIVNLEYTLTTSLSGLLAALDIHSFCSNAAP